MVKIKKKTSRLDNKYNINNTTFSINKKFINLLYKIISGIYFKTK